MSSNILQQVIEELNSSPFQFSMQLHESTDVSQCSQLLVFVRYVHHETQSIKEEFLFWNYKCAGYLQYDKKFPCETP